MGSGCSPVGTPELNAKTKGDSAMAHSYVCLYVHYVFSTIGRQKIITPDLEARLYPYMGGIARENNMKALAIGGVEEHSHVFLSLPSTITIAKAIQLIKGGSSKWVSDTFPTHHDFEWQEGYGAFSVSVSLVEDTIAYINNQREHHRKQTFEDEYRAILKKHGIEWDERYLFG